MSENIDKKIEETVQKAASGASEDRLETLELCIDKEHVIIPLERYTELVAAEVTLNIVTTVYDNTPSYDKDTLYKALAFLAKPAKKTDDTVL
jgi:Fe2+ or Zn2+ uptake regulation protein